MSAAEGLIEIQAGAVILAMGCRERTRGALNIPGTRPAGVLHGRLRRSGWSIWRAICPAGAVVILGSGDIGLIMARRHDPGRARRCKRVVELMPYSGGLNRNIVQCLTRLRHSALLSATPSRDIIGRERVEGVDGGRGRSRDAPAPSPARKCTFDCDTLLLSVGLIPENELIRAAGVAMDRVTSGAVV